MNTDLEGGALGAVGYDLQELEGVPALFGLGGVGLQLGDDSFGIIGLLALQRVLIRKRQSQEPGQIAPLEGREARLQSGFRSRLRFFGLDFDDGGLCKWTLNSLHH